MNPAAVLGSALILSGILALCEPAAAQTIRAAGVPDDGTPAALSLAKCRSKSSATCVLFANGTAGESEVELAEGELSFVDAQPMGQYDIGGAPHQLAYVYTTVNETKEHGGVWIFVIDLTAAKRIAAVATPPGYTLDNTYFDYIRGPRGEKHPFIAPGAHYLKDNHANPTGAFIAPQWNFLCLFDADRIADPDPACYTGFKSFSTSFSTPAGVREIEASGFRHDGGWVEDVDGDGWDDIHLPFLQYILTLSGKTGKQISLAHFDVAARSEPKASPYFHSGRFYGRFASFVEPDTGRHDVLFTDGEGVGYFSLYCGVSRYVAVAQWSPGPSLTLKWSNYLSFSKTVFKPPYASVSEVVRRGDDLNKCPHFFGTGLQWRQGRPLVIYSLFEADNPSPACQAELLEEQKSGFDRAASAAYETECAPKTIPAAIGHWSVHVLDALTGAELAKLPNAYLWGEASKVVPDKPQLFLIQRLSAQTGVAYSRTGDAVDDLTLVELVDGPSLKPVASFAGPPAAPVITGGLADAKYRNTNIRPAYPPGLGSAYGGTPNPVLRDIDADGLNDIQLKDGRWLGYSVTDHKLVVKSGLTPAGK